jgi:hypothetical protein
MVHLKGNGSDRGYFRYKRGVSNVGFSKERRHDTTCRNITFRSVNICTLEGRTRVTTFEKSDIDYISILGS